MEVQLNSGPRKLIVSFGDNVLEYFSLMSAEGSARYHVGHFKSIEITTDKKGAHTLEVKLETRMLASEVSEQALPKAQELVTAVQKAMASLKL
ncbi:MAG TPA: hypothetical protein VHM28_01065 [Anaerolineales bacterium]|nr:hypothetical protein [Anaerolineales bacterium]